MKKKILAVIEIVSMTMGLMVGCGSQAETETAEPEATEETVTEEVIEETADEPEEEPVEEEPVELEGVTVHVGAMSGPTAMTLVELMNKSDAGETAVDYEFADLSTEASAFVSPLVSGELDIACVPSNLASVIYNGNDGVVEVLATCNTGVLYVVQRGEGVTSLADLKDKTVYMTGEGAVPEYVVRYLLSQNGIDPDNDLTLQFCADTTEALSYISADEEAIAVLPQPFVTAACAQVEGLSVALDLNEEWAALDNGCDIITGVVVARREFVEANPNTVKQFLADYEESVAYTSEDVEGAAALIEQYGIVAKAAIAQKALPGCNLVAMTGTELKDSLSGFLNILYEQNPKSIGGALPADDFYYE